MSKWSSHLCPTACSFISRNVACGKCLTDLDSHCRISQEPCMFAWAKGCYRANFKLHLEADLVKKCIKITSSGHHDWGGSYLTDMDIIPFPMNSSGRWWHAVKHSPHCWRKKIETVKPTQRDIGRVSIVPGERGI